MWRRPVGLVAAACLLVPGVGHAATGDLDLDFGTGGVAILPADRVDAAAPPLVTDDGKVLVTGFHTQPEARAFVARLTEGGALDATLDGDGLVATDFTPAHRDIALGLGENGRFYVAGGTGGGKIAIERRLPGGALDTAFGSGGKVTVNLGNSVTVPTALVELPGGKLLVTAANDAGSNGGRFTVAQVDPAKGLDTSFGTKGKVELSFGKAASGAYDLHRFTSGAILAVGVAGAAGYATDADVALARLNPSGSLDTTFGTGGTKLVDVSGGPERGIAVAAEASGAFLVTGPTGSGSGFVARFTSAGALDGANFGSGGVVKSGLGLDGGGFAPADIARDKAGRLVVGGTTSGPAPASNRWTVLRLAPTGASPLDAAFSGDGRAPVAPCDGAGANVSGVASAGPRIVVAGSCTGDRRVAVARLLAVPSVSDVGIEVSPGTAAGGHEITRVSEFPTQSLTLAAGDGQSLSWGAWRGGAWRGGAWRGGAWRGGAWRGGAWRGGAWRGGAWRGGAIAAAIPLANITLSDPDGARPEISWAWLLDGTPLETQPLHVTTLKDVFDLRDSASAPAQFVTRFDSLTFDMFDTSRTPLRDLSLASLLLDVPLSRLAAPQGGWCEYLSRPKPSGAAQPLTCANGVDVDTTYPAELEFAGDDLSEWLDAPITLTSPTDVTSDAQAFVTRFALVDVQLSRSPLGDVKARDAKALLNNCTSDCEATSTKTLADVQAANPEGFSDKTLRELIALVGGGGSPDVESVSLAEVIPAIFPPGTFPVEHLSAEGIDALLDKADVRESGLHTATLSFTLDCSARGSTSVAFTLPADFRYAPGSGRVREDGGAARTVTGASVADGRVTFDSEDLGLCPGASAAERRIAVSIGVEPGTVLGEAPGKIAAGVSIAGNEEAAVTAAEATTIDDGRDTDDSDPARAKPIESDHAYLGWTSKPGDLDYVRLELGSDIPEGSRVTFTLSHLRHDADLVVLGPETGVPVLSTRTGAWRGGAWRGGAWRGGAWRGGALPDASTEPGAGIGELEPNLLQDMPIPELEGTTVRATSARRSLQNESATVVVTKGDAGGEFVAQVSGFNLADGKHPYVLRALVHPPARPQTCIDARSGVNDGPAGRFPQLPLPSTTETLFLINKQRMRNLNPGMDVDALVTKLDALAARSDVKGVVAAVESHPKAGEDERYDVRGAHAAADADPCSIEKVNAIVTRRNNVVDDLRKGLDNLKNIVLIGDDDANPFGRIIDFTELGNQQGEADYVATGGRDNPISRAFRLGYVLTDDSVGDFRPRSSLGGEAFVPQVAVGRLDSHIAAQIDQFMAADGRLNPQTARVGGYDFFADSATAQADALSKLVPSGATTRRITTDADPSNAWTAGQGQALLNDAGAAFIALNAHYTENEALPASTFYGRENALIQSSAVTPPVGSVIFTMGCHAGLSLPDRYPTAASDVVRLDEDWPQRIAASKSVYIASTGFGGGDTDLNAYTERLLTYDAQEMGADRTVGQSLMFAKQRYSSELLIQGPLPPFDAKATQQLVFYGLPMYKLGPSGTSAPSVAGDDLADPGPLTVKTTTFDQGDHSHRKVSTPRGDYWVAQRGGADQHGLVEHYRPLQPRVALDVTNADGLPVHGALITSLTSSTVTDANPVLALPLALSGPSRAPEPRLSSGFFPVGLAGLADRLTPQGRRDILTLATGQFRTTAGDGTGEQRLFSHIGGTLYRSNSRDYEPAVAQSIDLTVDSGVATWEVRTPNSDVDRVFVMYRTNASDVWRGLDLRETVADGRWVGGERLPDGTAVVESFAQLKRPVGSVGVAWNKGSGFVSEGVPSGEGDPKAVIVEPEELPDSGWFNTEPTVALDKGAHSDATFTYTVDDGDSQPYDGPFVVRGEGRHVVRFTGSDGSHTSLGVKIDLTLPSITGALSRAPDKDGWYRSGVGVTFTCDDELSGVAACGPARTIDTEGRHDVVGTARDQAGNERTAVVPVKLDRTGATASIDPDQAVRVGDQQLTGKAADALLPGGVAPSGVASVTVVWTPTHAGQARTFIVTPSCDAGGTSCTWASPLPPLGVYDVAARATDLAGNTGAPATASGISVTAG